MKPPHESEGLSLNRFFPSKVASCYHDGRTCWVEADTSDPFSYHGHNSMNGISMRLVSSTTSCSGLQVIQAAMTFLRCGMVGEKPVDGPCEVDLNRVFRMLEEDCTPFERAVEQENINYRLTAEEIKEAEARVAYLDSTAYMEAPALELKNASSWTCIVTANPWTSYSMVSNSRGWFIYKGRIFSSKGRLFMLLKHFS